MQHGDDSLAMLFVVDLDNCGLLIGSGLIGSSRHTRVKLPVSVFAIPRGLFVDYSRRGNVFRVG